MLYSRAFIRTVLGAAVIGGFVLTTVPPATAALYSPQQALSQQAIEQFLKDPGALLDQFKTGGPQMIAAVRDLAASDPRTLDAILGLLKTANPDQASAIGTALGQVALMGDQAYATQIQTDVVAAANDSALVAFSAVVGGNIKLSATTAGGGGGGGAEESTNPSNGGVGAGSGTFVNLSSFPNTPDNLTTITLSSGSPGTPGTNTNVSSTTP
jgi:hypothetical protein